MDENGYILNCDLLAEHLLGCQINPSPKQPIAKFIPQMAGTIFLRNGEIAPRLRFLSRIGNLFEIVSANGENRLCRLFFNVQKSGGNRTLRLIINPEKSPAKPDIQPG